MSTKKLIQIALFSCCLLISNFCLAQEETKSKSKKFYNERFGTEVRGKNAVTLAGGTAIMNGDFENPMWEIYFHAGYKRFIGSTVNINFTYHKFNLAYEDLFNNGFMSFDLNLEANLFPFDTFTPFIYVGGGLNASNYFKRTDSKVQGGGGVEFLATPRIGVKLFAEYNYLFTDELDGLEFGAADDVYWRMGFGLNLYFGRRGKSRKFDDDVPTVRGANPIINDY